MWRAGMCLGLVACGRLSFDETLDASTPLTLELATTQATINSSIAMSVTGGAPPYSISSDAGTIDVPAGLVWTPPIPGVFDVRVRDVAGDEVTATISCTGDFIYVAGGYDGNASAAVWRTRDGSSWTQIGALPAPRLAGALVVYDHRLYYLGGFSDMPDGSRTDDVWVSDDGVSWTRIGTLPVAAGGQAVAVFRGRIWLGGGNLATDAFVPGVWTSADGVAWRQEPPLPIGVHGARFAVHGDALWLVAGHELPGQSDALLSSSDGTTWIDRGSVPVAGEYHGVTSYAGQLWIGGGVGLLDRVVFTLDGSAWSDVSRLPETRTYTHLLPFRGELWVVGGASALSLHSIDGGAWTPAAAFPTALSNTAAVVFTPR